MTPQDLTKKYGGTFTSAPSSNPSSAIVSKYGGTFTPAPLPPPTGDQPGTLQNNPFSNFGLGIGSSIGKAGLGLAGLIAKGASKVLPGPTGQFATKVADKTKELSDAIFAKPFKNQLDTKSGIAGSIVGDIAPTMEGFGAASELEKTLPLFQKAKEGATLVQKALPVLARSALEGTTGAALTAAQTGGDAKQTRDAAILSGLFPIGSAAIDAAKGYLPSGKDAGARVVNSLIKPLLKDLSYGKNPGRAVAEEGITGKDLDELAQKIGERAGTIGKQIGKTIENDPKDLNISGFTDSIDRALAAARQAPETNSALISRLEGAKSDLVNAVAGATVEKTTVPTASGFKFLEKRNFDNIPSKNVFDLKKLVSKITKFTGNASDDGEVNRALKQTYGFLKEKLNTAYPTLETLNEKFADLSSAEIATKYRDKILQRQNLISAFPKLSVIGGGLASLATMNPIPFIAGMTEAAAQKALESPRVKLAVAKWLAQAPKAEVEAAMKKAPFLKALTVRGLREILPSATQ